MYSSITQQVWASQQNKGNRFPKATQENGRLNSDGLSKTLATQLAYTRTGGDAVGYKVGDKGVQSLGISPEETLTPVKFKALLPGGLATEGMVFQSESGQIVPSSIKPNESMPNGYDFFDSQMNKFDPSKYTVVRNDEPGAKITLKLVLKES